MKLRIARLKRVAPSAMLAMAAVQAARTVAPLDVIFAVDESASMKAAQDGVRAQVAGMFAQLAAAAAAPPASSASSFRVGLVGLGQRANVGNPVLRQALTRNQTSFREAADTLASFGGREPGYLVAQQVAANRVGGLPLNSDPLYPERFPGELGYCLVLVSDEDSDGVERLADTVNALVGTGGVFFAITSGQQEYVDLAEATGGTSHDLAEFVADSGPVLRSVLSNCASRVVRCPAPTYYLSNMTGGGEVAELYDGWTGCVKEPFNLEARPCEPPATTPVQLQLQCDDVNLVYRTQRYDDPWLLFGSRDDAGALPNRASLPNHANCRFSVTIDGATARISFTQACP
jgi:hypothetical protein